MALCREEPILAVARVRCWASMARGRRQTVSVSISKLGRRLDPAVVEISSSEFLDAAVQTVWESRSDRL